MPDTRRRVMVLGYVVIILLILLTAASYAWMSISSTPTVSDLALSVVTDNALEISHDVEGAPGEWGTILDMSTLAVPLKPATFLAAEDAFFAPNYGLDGRSDFSDPLRLTDENGALLSSADAAEDAEESGYLFICDFWIRNNSSHCTVALTPAMEREDGVLGSGTFVVGEPVWNNTRYVHEEMGSGAQYAIRVAFRVDETDDQGESNGEVGWILYEPNADPDTETFGAVGDGLLQGDYKLIRQEASGWKENTPVLRDTVIYSAGDFIDNDLTLFSMKAGHARHVTMYLWLEGQDAECTNAISEGRLFANIQFTAIGDHADNPIRPE